MLIKLIIMAKGNSNSK
uniref:Uncharacterized protein n=1 Tax=Arundo donax TaxID=35708 RepID=A0A0A9FYP1_ARUDO